MTEKRRIMLSSQLKINSSFKVVLVLVISLVQAFAWANEISFNTVHESALKNSADLKLVQSSFDEARYQLNMTTSAFLPKLGVEARHEKYKSDIEDKNDDTSNIFVEWNIFNGLRDVKRRQSHKAESQVARISKERFENNFEWIAKAKYAQAYALQEQVESYKKIIQSNYKNLETVRRQKSSGRLSDADFLEFQLFDAKLRQDFIRLELEASKAFAELRLFAGLPDLTKVTTLLVPRPLKLNEADIKLLLVSEKSMLAESKLKVESLEAAVSEETGRFLPTVDLKATRGSTGLREASYEPETIYSVNARWELFSGFEDVNSRKKALARLSQGKVQYANDQISSQSQAEQLLSQLNNITDRLKFEEENQKSVETFLKTVESEYRRGVKSSSDLKSALELILTTSLNRSALRADYFSSRARLQALLGQIVEEK